MEIDGRVDEVMSSDNLEIEEKTTLEPEIPDYPTCWEVARNGSSAVFAQTPVSS